MAANRDNKLMREVRDALTHLYDYAYLETHPLAARLVARSMAGGRTRAQETRRILLDAIELLNPGDNIPWRAPQRRAYTILFGLYVEGQDAQTLANALGIGGRQLRRDRASALAALANILRDRYLAAPATGTASAGAESLDAESQRLAQQRESINVARFIARLLPILEELARGRQVQLASRIAPRFPVLQLNATLLRQILLSLASQIIVHHPVTSLTFVARQQGDIPRIGLVPGYRSHVSLSAAKVAAGLPELESVQTMIAAAGGQLRCEASVLWVVLPRPPRRTVLVVDDKPELFELFKRYLADQPYQLLHAAGVDQALSLVRSGAPDIVVLDLMMPDRDGWEFLQAMRQDPVHEHLPVIICSVLHEPELAFSLGAQLVLKKPVGASDLLRALKAVAPPA
ncbi:response regulator [Litorilinea aerophila]|uniref:Response regulator n=1 Tax=Litorilinea aerophila TaxID=1204385 RepID=A0A540VIM7_9CHLR|nr:response regulator [Litorilinea aerophila]MCC9075790.1 response regulator [Litorilinea aerophila]OUC07972.1 hypothetical protein RY27_11760 [Litorilinea aerophila]